MKLDEALQLAPLIAAEYDGVAVTNVFSGGSYQLCVQAGNHRWLIDGADAADVAHELLQRAGVARRAVPS